MKIKAVVAMLAFAAFLLPSAADAKKGRRDVQKWKIATFQANAEYMARLEGFRFQWGGGGGTSLGTSESRRSTNGIGKSDESACQWALLSALLAIKADAQARGGTAVVNLRSFAEGADFVSTTEYQCISGATNSRVYIRGTIVR
jgi:hypothetical protein